MPITAVEGGLPIFKNGDLIGAIGISGVTSAQDGIIAEAALKAVGLME
ncbi:heme-binding protein [Mongoliitalea daihaiensis]|nr:heme-binding protein [Mongoliitalea daihaiensis]